MASNSNIPQLQAAIDSVWEERQGINPGTTGVIRDTVEAALDLLGKGEVRVAEKGADGWTVNQWLKKAVLLSFRLNDMTAISGAPGRRDLVGQGPLQVRRHDARRLPPRRLSRSAGLNRAPLGLHRAQRRPDAGRS